MIRSRLFRIYSWVFSHVFGTRFARLIWRVPGANRLYGVLMRALRPDTVVVNGFTLHLDPLDSLLLSLNGEYEPYELLTFARCIQPGDHVIDVGAHIGLYTVTASRKAGEHGQVHAFEPSSANADLLRRNIAAN